MSSLDRSLLYAWPWNKWFDVLSICLDLKWECEFAFQKGNTIWETVKPDFSQRETRAALGKPGGQLPLGRDTACPCDDPEAFGINQNDSVHSICWGSNWASESNIDQTIDWFLKQELSIWRWELYPHWGAKNIQLVPVFVWLHSITWIQMKFETSQWFLIFSCVGNYYNSSDLSFKTTAKYNNQIVKNAQ